MEDTEEEHSPEEVEGETHLVIGIDYGTTYTGVAYATPIANTCDLKEIDVVMTWGAQMDNHDKVPSVISYSPPTAEMEQQWGSSLSPDAISMVHTKLELEVEKVSEELDFIQQSLDGMRNLHFQHIKASGNLPVYTYKTPEAVVEDYLTNVFEYLENAFRYFTEELREDLKTDIVVTVPTGWSDRAVNATYRALTKAGFSSLSFPKLEDVLFITEPEAAAIYTARFLKDSLGKDFLKDGGYFILCDAGGGTVDVVSYKVKRLTPTFELEQIGGPTVDRCGSVFINMEFRKWLRNLIGPKNYQKIDQNTVMGKITSHSVEGKAMRNLMEQFDDRKKAFTGSEDGDIAIRLPEPLADLSIPGKVDEGEVIISNSVMCEFFDVCVGKIVELIKGHIFQIEARKHAKPKNLFLVGGFAESRYLQDLIRDTFKLYKMNLRRPETSWTAVVQGAVICGIEKETTKNLVKATSCRHNYGIRVAEVFSDTYHDPRDEVTNEISGMKMAEGQLLWLLNKGDVVLSSKPYKAEQDITVAFKRTDERSGQITIYRFSDDDDERPMHFRNSKEELTTACVLRYDLSDYDWSLFDYVKGRSKKSDCYIAILKLTLSLEGTNLSATVKWRGDTVAYSPDIMY